ncbi:MAG: methyltransferase domain-containing protein [Rhodospirillales bacterium]|nr:methyltransferase domain-containing protein [Rhodospirillales bacterium]
MKPVRLNIGCGMAVTEGWVNYDNSLSVRLAGYPGGVAMLLKAMRLVGGEQAGYIDYCRRNDVRHCNAVKRIPHTDQSVDVIYTSHMLEHLDRTDAARFLSEARRVLKTGGTIRTAVPDLGKAVDSYKENGDSDAFMESILVAAPPLRTFGDKLKLLATGYRHHQWMYDGNSLLKLLNENDFSNPEILAAGETTIPDPGALDLRERADGSVYVEAKKP